METPTYRYNLDLLRQTIDVAIEESSRYGYNLHYAIKANSNPKILETIAQRNLGADCVSGNEIKAALEAGFLANTIVFAGVGKTNNEIELAIDARIKCIHIESFEELLVVNQIAANKKHIMPIAFRLNPNLDAGTHKYITTGVSQNKFGLSTNELTEAIRVLPTLSAVELIGFHFHIGSQILNISKFADLAAYASKFYSGYKHLQLNYLNVGGGLGIDYENPILNPIPNFAEYFEAFANNLTIDNHIEVHFEPGRSIVGQCGELVTRVLYIKEGNERSFAVVDAGMNNLIRPALYQAKHSIYCESSSNEYTEVYDVVGPICESSDTFGSAIPLPKLMRGDLLAIRSAGAYGESMSSRYNLRSITPCLFTLKQEQLVM
ncbi:MAG: diaminopimelate decarboxylase [Bacteroidales bacterium]|jgi:diaminopimelate decarboxylase|nr:diaminopimelate decarboxylase [Bacteroidales bacterium]MDD4671616.1 diaminopimelate decarboxylase [Bacteroidales bacterium]MDY0347644.1 diaminopimelate decarboxylase [Tenuifilaceae bacterium]